MYKWDVLSSVSLYMYSYMHGRLVFFLVKSLLMCLSEKRRFLCDVAVIYLHVPAILESPKPQLSGNWKWKSFKKNAFNSCLIVIYTRYVRLHLGLSSWSFSNKEDKTTKFASGNFKCEQLKEDKITKRTWSWYSRTLNCNK